MSPMGRQRYDRAGRFRAAHGQELPVTVVRYGAGCRRPVTGGTGHKPPIDEAGSRATQPAQFGEPNDRTA
jgi:hypothetical protein